MSDGKIEWTGSMFMSGRCGSHGTWTGLYRGFNVFAANVRGRMTYAILNERKRRALAKFKTEGELTVFIDRLLAGDCANATFAEVQRLRALCEAHDIDPDWPLPDEADRKVKELFRISRGVR